MNITRVRDEPRSLFELLGASAVLALSAWCVSGNGQAAPIPVCAPLAAQIAECTYTRDVAFHYGTLSVVGAPSPSQELFFSTDYIPPSLRNGLQNDPAVDTRVLTGLLPFVNGEDSRTWTLGDPDNLPASQSLLDGYNSASAALSLLYGPGSLTFSALPESSSTYRLVSEVIFCDLATSVPPACLPIGDGDLLQILNYYDGRVFFRETNAIWTRDEATSVPEPSTFVLFGMGCLALARRLRKPQP